MSRSADSGAPKILFLLPTLRGGGAERVITTLARHFDRRRFQPMLAVVDTTGAAYLDDIPPDVEIVDLKCSRVRYAILRIARLIWKVRPGTVISTIGHLNLALAIIRPLLPRGLRYCARETILVSELVADSRLPSIWRWAYRTFYRRFDLIICQSRAMHDDLRDRHGIPPDRLVVINNPLDTLRIRRLSEEASTPRSTSAPAGESLLRLLSVGRLTRQKGFDLLIEAIALSGRSDLRLTLLGEGPLRPDLERLAEEHGVASQIEFAGFKVNPYPDFARADAFVLSSRYEGFPNVVLEALACGTPVISTPAAGVAEILDGAPGCIVTDSISAASLARALREFTKGRRVPESVVRPYEVKTIVRRYEDALT